MRANPNVSVGKPKGSNTAEAKALLDKKIFEIAKLLAKGVSQKKIKIEKSEEWGCTEQNINYLIRKALKSLQCSIDKKMDIIFALQRERMEFLLNGAIEKKDYLSAQKIIDSMNKMYGLYTEKKEVKIDSDVIKFDFGNINNDDNDEVSE